MLELYEGKLSRTVLRRGNGGNSVPLAGGLWQESIATNRASATAAKNELRATPTAAAGSPNALHAMDYMIYGHLQLAQDQAAKRLVDAVRAIQTTDTERLDATYALAAIPARYALERRRWDEAMALQLHPKDLAWDRFPQAEAVIVFSRALGAARRRQGAPGEEGAPQPKNPPDGPGRGQPNQLAGQGWEPAPAISSVGAAAG